MRYSRGVPWVVILTLAGTLACGSDAVFAPDAPRSGLELGARPEAVLRVANRAELVDGSAVVRVALRCPEGAEVLEAHVSVSQNDSAVFGETGISGVLCDGKRHRHEVVVTPFEGSFAEGEAFASGFLLFLQGDTDGDAQDAHFVRLRSRG